MTRKLALPAAPHSLCLSASPSSLFKTSPLFLLSPTRLDLLPLTTTAHNIQQNNQTCSSFTMQQTAISNHRTWLSEPSPQITTHHSSSLVIVENLEDPSKKGGVKKFEGIKDMVSENAIIVFGRRGCCMCHVVKRLLLGLGVNPSVYEVIDEKDEILLINELERLSHENDTDGIIRRRPITLNQFPCVYIGGKLFGGLDELMGAHISGDLIPILKKAGALWL